eukprot:403364513
MGKKSNQQKQQHHHHHPNQQQQSAQSDHIASAQSHLNSQKASTAAAAQQIKNHPALTHHIFQQFVVKEFQNQSYQYYANFNQATSTSQQNLNGQQITSNNAVNQNSKNHSESHNGSCQQSQNCMMINMHNYPPFTNPFNIISHQNTFSQQQVQTILTDCLKNLDNTRVQISHEVEKRNKKLLDKITFDIKFYLFAILQLILVNLLVFKSNYDYINIDLLLFSSLMLGRTIYLKVIAHNSYLGLQFQTRSFLGSSWSSVSQNFNGNTPSGSQQQQNQAGNIQNLSTLILNQKAQKQNQTSQLNNQNTQLSQAKRKVSRGNRHLLINAIMLTFMIVQLTCMWRLYFYNTLHNFICLFYPIMFELCLFGIQTKFALIDSPNHQEYASNQRYSSAIHEFLHLAKTVLFQSFEVAYYTGFITVKFIPQDLAIYFDTFTLQIFTMFLWINAVTILTSHYMQMRFVELQFNAQLLGKWSAYKA